MEWRRVQLVVVHLLIRHLHTRWCIVSFFLRCYHVTTGWGLSIIPLNKSTIQPIKLTNVTVTQSNQAEGPNQAMNHVKSIKWSIQTIPQIIQRIHKINEHSQSINVKQWIHITLIVVNWIKRKILRCQPINNSENSTNVTNESIRQWHRLTRHTPNRSNVPIDLIKGINQSTNQPTTNQSREESPWDQSHYKGRYILSKYHL